MILTLDTGFYLIFMHSLSVVAVPLNVLSIFCILYKSTKQMGSYKWYLLIYQLTSTVFDFIYLALTLPIIFFPIPMGYPASWIAPWISITSHLSVLLVVYIGSFFAATIVSLFIYRCHVVTPTLHFSRINNHGHVYKNAILFPSFAIPVLITSFDILPDQVEARTWVEKLCDCILQFSSRKWEHVAKDERDAKTIPALPLSSGDATGLKHGSTYSLTDVHLRNNKQHTEG
ncbi:7TM chemoreceptor [Cooperia oncophora]